MAFGILPLLFLSLTCSAVALHQEEMNFFTLSLFTTCKFRRNFDRRICCNDIHCPAHACCQLGLASGGMSVLGKCVPRDPHTSLCTRRKRCYKHRDCGPGSCCRFAEEKRGGVCDRLGQEGDKCRTRSRHGYRYSYHILCPCANGLTCQSSGDDAIGCCRAPATTSTTTAAATMSTTTTAAAATSTTTVTATSTASPTTTTDSNSCGCPDLTLFCCVGSSCQTRPSGGETCDATTGCPCVQPSVCSDQGVCAVNTI